MNGAATLKYLILFAFSFFSTGLLAAEEMNDHRLAYHLDSWIALAMTVGAVVITVMLNGSAAKSRTIGTLIAALACFTSVLWFFWAMQSGIFESPRPPLFPTDGIKPALLTTITAIALAGGVFLLWATMKQTARAETPVVTNENDSERYGQVSRYLHWTTAILFLSLIPMGIFTTLIPEDLEWRQGYYVVHKTIGIMVFILVFIRIIWHFKSMRPALDPSLKTWERLLAKLVHYGLYFLMIALPITGFAMSTYGGKLSHFFNWDFPLFWEQDMEAIKPWGLFHKVVLPYLFYLIFLAHILGVLKHHFMDKHPENIRRIVS